MSPVSKTTAANKLTAVVETLISEMDRDAPIAQLLAFLVIATSGSAGISQSEVQKTLKLSTAGMSRTVQALSALHYFKDRPGFGLVERIIDQQDNRFRTLKLTPKGEKLMQRVSEVL